MFELNRDFCVIFRNKQWRMKKVSHVAHVRGLKLEDHQTGRYVTIIFLSNFQAISKMVGVHVYEKGIYA